MNVHVLSIGRQHNGNYNGVGIIITDHHGRLVKGLSGPIPGLPSLATQLWAIHTGLMHAQLEDCKFVTLETDNYLPYYEVERNDGRGDKSCAWVVEQIKKLLDHEAWFTKVIYVDENANKAAHYLAAIGLKHWSGLHHFYEPFGRLQERMNLDMGFGPPLPQLISTPIPRDENGDIRGFAPRAAVPDYHSDNGGGAAP